MIAEFDTRPGTRPRPRRGLHRRPGSATWPSIVEAQAHGEIAPDTDPDQIGFEIESALLLANTLWVLDGDPSVLTAPGPR